MKVIPLSEAKANLSHYGRADNHAIVVEHRDALGAAVPDCRDLGERRRRGFNGTALMGERHPCPPAMRAEAQRLIGAAQIVKRDRHRLHSPSIRWCGDLGGGDMGARSGRL